MSAADDARGPWKAEPCGLTSGYSVLAPRDEYGVQTVVASYVPAECAPMVECAPEMLAALQELEAGLVYLCGSRADEVLKRPRALIARATRRLP